MCGAIVITFAFYIVARVRGFIAEQDGGGNSGGSFVSLPTIKFQKIESQSEDVYKQFIYVTDIHHMHTQSSTSVTIRHQQENIYIYFSSIKKLVPLKVSIHKFQ